ncbi:hypothetical protein EBB05_23215 [Methylobacterium brachiatum]|nr:hypothetical protein EBB05_23215 [Methylobacterium brachiatum]
MLRRLGLWAIRLDQGRGHILGRIGRGSLSRAGEGQGEGCDFFGWIWSLTPALSRTGEEAWRGLHAR